VVALCDQMMVDELSQNNKKQVSFSTCLLKITLLRLYQQLIRTPKSCVVGDQHSLGIL